MTLACGLCFSHSTRASRRGTFSGMSRRARARVASPARAKTFRARRRGAIRTNENERFFVSFLVSVRVQSVPGSLPVVPDEPSTDRARVSRRTAFERKNPKKNPKKHVSGAQRRDVNVCGSVDEGCRVQEHGEPGGGWRVAPGFCRVCGHGPGLWRGRPGEMMIK